MNKEQWEHLQHARSCVRAKPMTRAWLVLLMVLGSGCAVRYKSGASCWSFEMVSTEDWCEKQRVIEKASRAKSDKLLIEQLQMNRTNQQVHP